MESAVNHLIAKPVFAMSLSLNETYAPSTIEFGSFNETFLTQKIYHFEWLPIRSQKAVWWEIELSGARYGNKDLEV